MRALARAQSGGQACASGRVPRSVNRAATCVVHAGTGFGKSSKKAEPASSGGSGIYTAPTRKKRVDLAQELGLKQAPESPPTSTAPAYDLGTGNWFQLAQMSDLAGKDRKVCELKGNKKMVVLRKHKDAVYAMDAFSTAYQYPLLDGTVEDGPEGPTIETPLDGTVYDLRTGKVVKWCPSDGSPIRGLLRTLKSTVQPIPLSVYPVVVQPDGKVMVRLS